MNDILITRTWAMPSGETFTIKPIKELVEAEVNRGGRVIDPFARNSKYGTITNDLNPDCDTTFHMDALMFLQQIESESADLVLYDPPYSITQAAQLYKSFGKERLKINVANMRYWKECKDNIARILKKGGRCLCFGWNTNGLGKGRGFEMTEILIVAHGGSKNDTLCTVEYKR